MRPKKEKGVLRGVGNSDATEDNSYLLQNLVWVKP